MFKSPIISSNFNSHYQPTALYNAMVAPIINYTIKGFCWYQGESNASRPEEYAKLQPALINDWRKKWSLGELPFLYVQLPGFMDYNYEPSESNWALMREAQLKSLTVPNTAMAVAIDLGEWNDINPDNKKDVGERLALAALNTAYGETIVASGPIYKSAIKTEGNKMILHFTNTGSGLTTNDGEAPSEFAIAGADKKFVWAKTKIENDNIIVWNNAIANPLHVRYAWADNPVNPNLTNKEGLPASPFNADMVIASGGAWNNKKCAVVITYDDAIDEHLNNAIPVLDSLNLKASFYITAFSNSIQTNLNNWRRVAVNGHELGNHTLYHPCMGGTGREWVGKEYDMQTYSIKRMLDEVRMTNLFLQAVDGKTRRTFAFTCGDMKIGDSLFINAMKKDFVAARAVRNEMHTIDKIDLFNIDCYMVNNHRFEQMKAWVDKAIETNSLLVILFHGVGGGNGLNVSINNHSQFLHYLKENENKIWTTTMLDAADYIKESQNK